MKRSDSDYNFHETLAQNHVIFLTLLTTVGLFIIPISGTFTLKLSGSFLQSQPRIEATNSKNPV